MLSARGLWLVFTVCIIVMIEGIVVAPLIDWCVVSEVSSGSYAIPNAPKVDDPTLTSEQSITARIDALDKMQLRDKWEILYEQSSRKAMELAGGLFLAGVLAGFVIASLAFRHLVRFGDRLQNMSATDAISVLLGGVMGLSLSAIFLPVLLGGHRSLPTTLAGGFIIVYICIYATMSMKEELKFYFPGLSRNESKDLRLQKPKIFDTNVIIDGRVADVCGAGFIEGQVLIPSFILEELQHIADSSDSLRRARGRRGLDILNQMRKDLNLVVKQCDPIDHENQEEVDVRLVKLAKEIDGCIVTNDFNLNKVAELQGVQVFNINELANALKPVVLPGEEMAVTVIKEGKEMNQGIAYLDDGTMIVVEGGKRHIGEVVDVIVTSVLQTVAGKMIFANLKSVQDEEDNLIDRNVRNYSGFRPRKKTS